MKIIRKLKARFKEFKINPVTKGKEISSLFRYIVFNLRNRVSNEILYKWIDDLKFFARKGDAGIVGNIYFGLYEFEESIFLLHLLEKEDVFLDVGANVGHFSLLMSGIKKCKSIAIEPVPKTYNQLLKQIKLNNLEDKIETLNIGVSNEKGELFFSIDRGTMDRIVTEKYINSVRVAVSTLDLLIDKNIPIAIKIDVEGYEKYVLDGASILLQNKNVKVIILELNRSGEQYGINDNEIYLKMLDFGFKPFSYDVENRKLIKLDSYNKHKFNTLFVRDEAFVAKRISESRQIGIRNRFF